MISPRFHNRIGKICALIAATLILPALAYSGQNDQGNQNVQGQNGQHAPVDPEVNAASVLVPFFGAVLLFFGATTLRSRRDCVPQATPGTETCDMSCGSPGPAGALGRARTGVLARQIAKGGTAAVTKDTGSTRGLAVSADRFEIHPGLSTSQMT
jgi:hypothetical protein